jgi:hypothetical protein
MIKANSRALCNTPSEGHDANVSRHGGFEIVMSNTYKNSSDCKKAGDRDSEGERGRGSCELRRSTALIPGSGLHSCSAASTLGLTRLRSLLAHRPRH